MTSKLESDLLPLLFLLLITTSASFGQFAQRGGIDGSILDSSGAAIPNAPVTLTDVDHNQTRSVSTDAAGHFEFTGLVSGQYLLSVQRAGFEAAKSDPIQVTIGATVRYDLRLALGSAKQTVTVSSASPLFGHESR